MLMAQLLTFLLLVITVRFLHLHLSKKKTVAGGTRDVEKNGTLEYLNNFRRTHETPLLNCEGNLTLTSSDKCVLSMIQKFMFRL